MKFKWPCVPKRRREATNTPPLPQINPDEEIDEQILPDDRYIKVLIAEDNAISVTILKRMLMYRPNLVVEHTGSGMRALEMITAPSRDNAPYSLLVLDLHLPQMSGMDILKGIRRRNIDCPILIITADEGMGKKCLKLGANAMLTKPVKKKELLSVVDELITPVFLDESQERPPIS